MDTYNDEKKKKLVEIVINGTEKCLEARDENDDTILMLSGFSYDDLVFQVDGNEYIIDDFAKTDYANEEFDPQKAHVVFRDFIYPDETDESMLVAFVYDGIPYTDICPETQRNMTKNRFGQSVTMIGATMKSTKMTNKWT